MSRCYRNVRLLLGCMLFVCSILAWGQIQSGQFQGTILDQSGAAVPSATVTATNTATGQAFTAHSSGSGFYALNQLPIGSYNVKATAQGFKAVETKNQVLNAGMIEALNFKLTLGEVTQTVEVTSAAPLVQTDDPKLSATVGSQQINNLPLNGHDVYDLMQLQPGATNVRGVMAENGANTVVNGVREDFNGFTINGVSNKGLSGGTINVPIADSVQEFQELTLNNSAQYGNSAGSITNLVTKSGTNSFHGDAYEFVRNDVFDANNFFINHNAPPPGTQLHNNPELRFNQFGGTFGGPLIKDKLFFFAAYQGDRFITTNSPTPSFIESPEFRAAVEAANPGSVAALLYSSFPPLVGDVPAGNINDFLSTGPGSGSGAGLSGLSAYLCPALVGQVANGGSLQTGTAIAQKLANIFGVTPADQAACTAAGGAPLPLQAGTFSRTANFFDRISSVFKSQSQILTASGDLFNGNEGYLRLDYNMGQNDRIFTSFNWMKQTDQFGPGLPQSVRGFANPTKLILPNFQFNYVHTFSPNLLNEFRAGYTANIDPLTNVADAGVPQIGYDTGDIGFGSYSGYPQFFKENIYTYSDLVTYNKGNHNMKMGVDVRRNIENSEFNVARPSYYFFDELYFAGDAPYTEGAGVDPGIASGTNVAQLQSNVRHWRNIELGAYYQDDWKVTRKLTLNLGLRYDLFTRHNEKNNLATQFIFGSGSNLADQVLNANVPAGSPGCNTPAQIRQAQLAGVCGPGGFAAASSLGSGDHNNFGPRLGFAYDVFGNGKTSVRGGVGASYEGTLYNPLSNSRWNLPFYSFNRANSAALGQSASDIVVYGPQTPGVAPSFTGPPDPANFEGTVGAQATGNINGWAPSNANQATLTGIVPKDIRDPYVFNYYLGVQHEILPQTVMEIDYVGTAGHKLFRAENINHIPGSRLPVGDCVTDNLGRQLCGLGSSYLNPNYKTLREWRNVNNSIYGGLQASLRHQFSHGLQFAVNYTYSHSIDNGSTWHSGATTSNGAAAGEGFSSDLYDPGLDRGNSIYDVRHRIVANYVWELPIFKNSSNWFAKNVLGGWQTNGIWSYQSGAHWEPACISASSRSSCDFNLNGIANDRPNAAASNIDVSHDMWANGWGSGFVYDPGTGSSPNGFFTKPCTACAGSEGRNTFLGPNYFDADLSLFKTFKMTERTNLQFRFETFNSLNRTNFELPGANAVTNNRITHGNFGQAAAAFNPRQLQFGLKLSF